MTIVLGIVLTVVNAAWLFLVVLGLPGTWLMVAGTLLVAWWQWEPGVPGSQQMFSPAVLIAVVALAAAGELAELLAGVFGSKAAGGTRRGAVGALVGGLIGGVLGTFLIPLPLLGSLIGTCAGAGVGAWGLELQQGRTGRAALKSGVGAGVGRLLGTVAKLVAGGLIWITAAVAAFWP